MRTIVTAWAEKCDGPGWANWPVWVLMHDGMTGKYTVECLQMDEQTDDMLTMSEVSDAAHRVMVREARRVVK